MEPQPFSDERLDVYLASRPRGAGWIYLGILTLVLATAAALPLVRVPVVARSAGILQPLEEPQRIITPIGGRLRRGSITSGQRVSAGDTLLQLDDGVLQSRRQAVLLRIGEVGVEIRAVRALLADSRAAGAEPSTDPGGDAESRLDRGSAELRWRNELRALQREELALAALAAALTEEIRSLTITAPSDGVITDRMPLTPGGHVAAGEVVATLVPTGPLVAVAYVEPHRLAKLAPGDGATVRSGRGTGGESWQLPATVVSVRSELVEINGQLLGQIQVLPLSGNDREALRRGLPVTVHFPMERRSLWALLQAGSEPNRPQGGRPSRPADV